MPACARVSVCYLSMQVVCAQVSRGEQRVRASESGRVCNLFISGGSFQSRHSWCHESAPIDGRSRWVTVAFRRSPGTPGCHGRGGPSGPERQWARNIACRRAVGTEETVRRCQEVEVVISWIWTRRPRTLSHTPRTLREGCLPSSTQMPDAPLNKSVFCCPRVMGLCGLLDWCCCRPLKGGKRKKTSDNW